MFTKLNRRLILFVLTAIALSTLTVTAQENIWSANTDSTDSIVKDKAVARQSFPTEFRLFNLNIEPLKAQLMSITDQPVALTGNSPASTVILLPNADGVLERYEVFEASNFEPALQEEFPNIRAFSGRGLDDRYAMLKLSLSPQGIQTTVFRAGRVNEYIEPYSQDRMVYAVFSKSQRRGELPWACTTEERNLMSSIDAQVSSLRLPEANTGTIRTMRLAQSVNGEYSNFFGATAPAQVALVLAAVNATVTRTNGTYEKDLAVHLNLIANTTDVFYYNPATDPYSTLGNWNNELMNTLATVIGAANYDIGHLFGASGGGGNAGCIGCVCSADNTKGRGITSPADGIPQGDNFDIDYVAHEVGHQMGGNHTFSHGLEAGGVNNVEVGSGVTIMGYAGITSFDVDDHSIDVWHERSIQQIQTNLPSRPCPVAGTTTMTLNTPPVVAPLTNYTIPITTPFALTGSATDPESDPLTYNWEQNDSANSSTTGANSPAFPTKASGPNWLSQPNSASPTRFMPKLSTILAGLAVTGPNPGGNVNTEALSSVARTLNFRFTAKDNKPYVPGSTIGQTQFQDMVVTVSNAAGPFQVTTPNSPVIWGTGSSQTITWDVAGTTGAPINTANVNILYSSDGGNTFPTVLASNTANDGSETVTMPGAATTTARIKVEAVGNIYFDISNTNFTLTSGPVPTPTPTPTPTPGVSPTPTPPPPGCAGQTFVPSGGLPAAIPDNSPAGTSLTIPVSGLTGTLTSAQVRNWVWNPLHTWGGDIKMTLQAPSGGPTATIVERRGNATCPPTGFGSSNDLVGPYNFGDAFPNTFHTVAGNPVPAGDYAASQCVSTPGQQVFLNTVFGGPVRPGGEERGMDIFDGMSPEAANGNWTLNISDNAGGDTGTVSAVNLCLVAGAGGPTPTPTPGITPTPTPPATPSPTPPTVNCNTQPGIIIHDDGTMENGYSANPSTITMFNAVDKFTPSSYPSTFTSVCVAFITIAGTPTTLNFNVIAYDDDGAGGAPGTQLGTIAATATGIPGGLGVPVWQTVNIAPMNLNIGSGSVYLGVRYVPMTTNVFVASDESTGNPVGFAGGYARFDTSSGPAAWGTIQSSFTAYRSMFVRAVAAPIGGPSPTPTPTPPPATPTPTPTPPPSPSPSCTPGVWQAGPAQTPARYAFQSALGTDNKLYVVGGSSGDNLTIYNQVSRFDPVTNTWSNVAPLPVGLSQTALGAAGGKIYVAGGWLGGTTAAGVVNTLRIYDIATDTWSSGANLPAFREAAAGAVVGGKFYVIGGDDFNNAVNTTLIYDIATDTWSTGATLPDLRTNLYATASGGFVYVYGGLLGPAFNTATDTLLRYDPVANTWTNLGSAGTVGARGNYGGISPLGSGQLLITDGANGSFAPSATTHIFTISSGTFAGGPTLGAARAGHAQGTLPDGRVMVVDGLTTSTTALSTVELLSGPCPTASPTPTPPPATPTPTPTPTPPPATPTPTPTPTPSVTPTPAPFSITFVQNPYTEDESQTAVIGIARSGDLSGTNTVTFTTSNGTATGGAAPGPGLDYQNVTTNVTFNPNETLKTVNVPIFADLLSEPTETVNLTLTGWGTLAPEVQNAVLNINDTATAFRFGQAICSNLGGPADVYPAPINVATGPVQIGNMRVTLYDLEHVLPDNLDVLLVGPGGQKYVLMGDAGGAIPIPSNNTVTLSLRDAGPGVLPNSGPLTTGNFEPTNWETPVTNFPGAAPAGPYNEPGSTVGGTGTQTFFGNFGLTNANGVWNLYVRDDAGTPLGNPEVVTGCFNGGWGIEFLASTAANASVSGRVLTAGGQGIRNAEVVISGGTLTEPMRVQTGSFGYYNFEGLQTGQTYMVTVNSRRYLFAVPTQVLSLTDNVADLDFVAIDTEATNN